MRGLQRPKGGYTRLGEEVGWERACAIWIAKNQDCSNMINIELEG